MFEAGSQTGTFVVLTLLVIILSTCGSGGWNINYDTLENGTANCHGFTEGSTDMDSQFIMPLKSVYNKTYIGNK